MGMDDWIEERLELNESYGGAASDSIAIGNISGRAGRALDDVIDPDKDPRPTAGIVRGVVEQQQPMTSVVEYPLGECLFDK